MTSNDSSSQADVYKAPRNEDGSIKFHTTSFRDTIERGGKFEPECDRYHLYASYACPWATRTLIVRKLKGLEDIIPVTIVSPRLGANGWPFASVDEFPGAETDPLYNSQYVKELYLRANTAYTGRFSVPLLWDKKNQTIVNNESAEIIRIFNSAFNEFLSEDKAKLDLYPEDLRAEIDSVNDWVYHGINNGVYSTGMAATQAAYEKNVHELFDSLDKVEKILQGRDYLVGDRLTEADIRLWVTIIRFDPVYVGQFKCNIRTIRDGYPAIHSWLRKLYWNIPAFKDSTDFDHIKTTYYWSHASSNPTRIIPVGPIPNVLPL
ncbi:glutathione S-transferase Gst3 [Coprinopsis cinerea okayama7|uniref:Glutathione S-transferase Gst3 n=1 Tax=Coprinopsis cinerea (strain Okayama-7 / 130 / ATCC MYA-4618 / FGSC 9003) TaxID=240176 RepID=A8NW16_COPC7|nr:glutathione S-transferase Gst3 [Coprinopsis cinerea okayama7\|eukprot:XP_001836803.2 glutathione S-transferase Gst3 [Coprinopsis cinerea okayama7\